jgi:DNA-binding transcriptional LysR family regulator
MSDFDWNDLRSFLAVVRTGRLTAAALQLGIEHSTLSRRIKGLEKALQARLFDRLPTGYVLTGAGEKLVVEAEAVESLMIKIGSKISEPGVNMAGSVRIATPEGFGTYFLANHLRALMGRHPSLKVELIANPHVVNLAKREADIAVMMSRPERGRLRARKLCDYELGLYASKGYLAERGMPAGLEDIIGDNIIGYISDLLPTPSHDYLRENFGTREPDLRISNVLTQLSATLAGAGYCILPAFMASQNPGLIRVLAKEVRIIRAYWLVIHPELRAPARARATIDFFYEIVREKRQLFLPSGNPQ